MKPGILPAGRLRMLLTGLSIGMLVAATAATPAWSAPDGDHLIIQEKLDRDGGEVHGIAPHIRETVPADLRAPVWPAASRSRVTLPGKNQRQAIAERAGTSPVSVSRAAGAEGARPSSIAVEVLDREKLPARWRDGVVTRMSADVAGAATVAVDYDAFRNAYGAAWPSRLSMWELPECALVTPSKAGCEGRELSSKNDQAAATVSAKTAIAATGTLVALAADASGDSGDFGATSLAASSTWTSGGSSGEFSWKYPVRVPATPGGPQPQIELSYSSSSVDGRSSATNNQPSWIGEGFEFTPGYIERRYIPCADDMAGEANNSTKTADSCWRSDNATMNLNGSGTELIFESGNGWHARNEDGATIEKLTNGSGNGDNDGEYWKVTTNDGVQYYFGRHSLPGQSTVTNSVNTVRVFGNHTDEPCHAATFADSGCDQAWRWNLDYVVDARGNTMSLRYAKEWNKYAARATATNLVSYVRASTLTRVDYGTWDRSSTNRSVTPTAQVVFDTADRCLADCSTHDAKHWPDVPWDQECKDSATSCPSLYAPTFWTTKRLSKITTRVWDTTKATPDWQDVDSWTLGHSFPLPGDGSSGGLWLKSITQTGLVGAAVTMPPVTFEPEALPNRVLTKTNTTNNWQRLSNIYTETGARIQVTYSTPDCTDTDLPTSPHNNDRLCYPVVGPDPYDADKDITEWWHKYVVRQISESDIQISGGHHAPPKITSYTYEGKPAWHYADDDGFTKPKRKTWDQFRGYQTVATRVGDTEQTLTRTTYFRGMHGDRAAPSGGTRPVTVAASVGDPVNDEDQFSGMTREQVVYNGTTDKPVSKTVSVPWRSRATASRTINGDEVTARFVDTAVTYTGTALGTDGADGWRITRSTSTYDPVYGTVTSTQDDGDMAVSGDESCTTTTYTRNAAKNLTSFPSRVTTTALPCDTTLSKAEQLISDVRNYYDGATSTTTAPVSGSVTRTEQMKDWTPASGTVWQTSTSTTFDVFGRPKITTDVRGNTTTSVYTPESGVTTKVTSTTGKGWVTSVETKPYWGKPWRTTDANGLITNEADFDGLGRTVAVWKQGWEKSAHASLPSEKFTYSYSASRSAYPVVKTETLNVAGNYLASYEIFDGFLRSRQTQRPAVGGGRVVTDTITDAWGRIADVYTPHAEQGTASGTLWWEPEWSVPAMNRTVYDRAGRKVAESFMAGDGVTNLVEKWKTVTEYRGDRTLTTPPAGGTATTTITDAQDHVVELRQHTTAAGVDGAYDATKYVYDPQGRTTKVTDTAQNVWQYTFDPRGRVTKTKDPDKGTITSEYNEYGDLTKTTDARGEVLVYEYDTLGRKIGLYDDTISAATKRAGWTWDFLYDDSTARGKLTASVRYENGNAYRWQVRGFNKRYQPTGVNYVIPAETGLAKTYTYAYGFADTDGSPTTATFPAAGGLATETVTTGYDETTGLANTLATNLPDVGSYVAAQGYSSYGEPTVTTRKTAGGLYTENGFVYDTATRRVARTEVLPESAAGVVSRVEYTYDPAGNITSLADLPEVGVADTQCFTYDKLRRLTSAWTPKPTVTCATAPSDDNLGGAAPYWTEWTIDKIGNRAKEVQHTTAGKTTRTYTVPASGATSVLPHAATAVTTQVGSAAATTQQIGYNDTGSVDTRTGPTGAAQTITWDPEGRPVTLAEGPSRTTQLFDADGTRLLRRDPTATTLFLPGMELRRENTGAVTATRTYSFAGAVIASRTPGENGLTWIFGDHQGTGQIAVNAATQKVTIRRQTPYGETRGTAVPWPTAKGFVGGDLDPTGLIHIGAREYDPATGRFLSVDPVIDFTDPQQMNAYSYAQNTPVTMMDPDGQRPLIGESAQQDSYIMAKQGTTMKRDNKGKWRTTPRYPSPRKDRRWPTAKTTETGRNTMWNRYLYSSQAQIDARAQVVNNWSIATALGAYYTGAGPETQNWYQVDELTMGIRGSDHMGYVRDLLGLMLGLGDYPATHQGKGFNYDLPSGMEGGMQAGADISNMAKNGLQGDPKKRQSAAASAIGSYKLGYEVMAVDPDKGRAVVAFHGTNTWDRKSGMRPPWIDKKDWNPVEPTSGAQRPVKQNFYWVEVIDFSPTKPVD